MTTEFDTDQLARLIQQKHDVLEQLRDLSRRQGTLIDNNNVTSLLSILSAKQQLLAQLQACESAIDPFRKQDPEARSWRSPADRVRCRQMAERCDNLLNEIKLIERNSESALVERRDAVASRLEGTHAAARAARAYAQGGGAPRRQLDLEN